MRCALLALLAFSPVMAQKVTQDDVVNRTLLRAHTLAPEFAADIILQLADSRFVTNKSQKAELIDEAFKMAGTAQNAFPRQGGHWTDSQLGMVHAAGRLSMDGLSLRTRSIEAMLPVNPTHAREMFLEIHLPSGTRLSCKDSLVPIFDQYFRTLLKVFQKSFSADERRDGADLDFISQRFRAIDSPLQIAPALKVALELKSPDLIGILAGVVKNLSPAPRSVTALPLSDLSVIPALGSAGVGFLEAYREFLVSAYGKSRCSVALEMFQGGDPLTPPIRSFNGLVAQLEGLNPITKEEVQNYDIEESYKEKPFWDSSRSRELLRSLQWLTHGNRDLPGDQRFWTPQERTSLEWTSKAIETLKQVDGWKADDESSSVDYFYMKSHVYETLAKLAPLGAVRDRAINHLLVHLASSYADVEDHVAWFLPAHNLLNADAAFYAHEMSRSANPVLSAYGDLTILLGSVP
jgi:hypothetical protein